jgi:hypothetical protein
MFNGMPYFFILIYLILFFFLMIFFRERVEIFGVVLKSAEKNTGDPLDNSGVENKFREV